MGRYDGTGIGETPQCAECRFFLPAGSREEGHLRANVPAAFHASRAGIGFCGWGVALKVVFSPPGRRCSKDQSAPPGSWPRRVLTPPEEEA